MRTLRTGSQCDVKNSYVIARGGLPASGMADRSNPKTLCLVLNKGVRLLRHPYALPFPDSSQGRIDTNTSLRACLR